MAERPRFRALVGGPDFRVKMVGIGTSSIDGDPPCAAMLRAGETEVLGFEPDRAAFAALEARRGPLEPDPALRGLFQGFPEWGRVRATETVQTLRLDDVPEVAGADLLKLDIQGAERMVLRHARARLAEVAFLPLYGGRALFTKVELVLRGLGFRLHRFLRLVSRAVEPMVVNNDSYAGLSQLVWADAVVMRDPAAPARHTERQFLAGAVLLHDGYRAFDAAYLLLAAHDRRHGGDLALRYVAGLRAPLPRAA